MYMEINNSKIYYLRDTKKNEPNGGNKAKSDFYTIFEKMKFRELDFSFKSHNKIIRNFEKILLPVRLLSLCKILTKESIVIVQIPTYAINIYSSIFFWLKKIIRFRMILIIHDIERLRNIYHFSKLYLKNEDKYLKKADIVICHNEYMKKYLENKEIDTNRIVVLGIFDYILNEKEKLNIANIDNKMIVNVAGSLDVKRSPYIYKLLNMEFHKINLKLYGPEYNLRLVKKNSNCFMGCYPASEIPYKLYGGWGLVWDGDRISDCSGNYGKYLVYINQHKVSLYIAAGLPIIIWEKAGLADFVAENEIGILISDLRTLEDKIENVDDRLYMQMVKNIEKIREKLLVGSYAELAIKTAVSKLETKK